MKSTIEDIDLNFDAALDLSFDAKAPKKKTAGESLGITHASLRTGVKRRRCYDLSRVPDAVALIKPLPKAGHALHALMGGDFHAWDLIPAIQLLGCDIADLYITTLGFNHGNNRHLCEMLDAGQVQRCFVLCSEYFRDADRAVYNEAEQQLQTRGSRIKAVRNHSKIICMAPTVGRDRYVVESSANLRSCNNLEQFALTNDAQLFKFHSTWIRRQFK